MTDRELHIVIVAWLLTFIFAICAGMAVGAFNGHDEACKSVGGEWVKDRCMKVTREAMP